MPGHIDISIMRLFMTNEPSVEGKFWALDISTVHLLVFISAKKIYLATPIAL